MEQYNDDNATTISSVTSPTTTDYSNMDSPKPSDYNNNNNNNGNYSQNVNMNYNGNYSPKFNMNNNNNDINHGNNMNNMNNMNNFANMNYNAFPGNYNNVNNNVNIYNNNNNNNKDMNYFKYNDSEYKPKLLPKIKAKQLNPLKESKQGKLPSPVLTKMNSKEWNNDNFDVYEQELKEQINHLRKMSADSILKYIQIEPKSSKKKKKHKRHSSLTFNNSHEWSHREMTQYEHDMLSEFNHLANQIKTMSESTSSYYQ